jgi:LacI family transcriptional regulator, galactose operon repressor
VGCVPTTLGQVAQEAGVSTSTVSRAFSHPHLLSSATVERITGIARRLGYSPNRSARALVTGRSTNLGLVVPDIANPYFPPLIKAAQLRARERGYCVFLADTDENPHQEWEVLGYFGQEVAGVVLCAPRMRTSQVRSFAEHHRTALVNRKIPGLSSVLVDSSQGLREAMDHLAGLGHRRVVYLGGPKTSWANTERGRVVRSLAGKHGMDLQERGPYVPSHGMGRSLVDVVLASKATAVVAFDDLLASGLVAGLVTQGVGVPSKISVVGCDDVLSAVSALPLSSVTGAAEAAGRTAIDVLLDLVEDADTSPRSITLETRFIARDTTGKAPRRR